MKIRACVLATLVICSCSEDPSETGPGGTTSEGGLDSSGDTSPGSGGDASPSSGEASGSDASSGGDGSSGSDASPTTSDGSSTGGGGDLECTLHVAPDGDDANDGSTLETARRTIQSAVDTSTYGDVVCVHEGTYEPFVVARIGGAEDDAILQLLRDEQSINAVGSGTLVSAAYPDHARTRIVSVVPHAAKVSGVTNGITNHRHFTDIQGFEVTADADDVQLGIANDGSSVRIVGNHVYGIRAYGFGNAGGAGINSYGIWLSVDDSYYGSDVEITDNDVSDINGPRENSGFVQGIYGAHPGIKLINNRVENLPGWCLHGWHDVKEWEIRDNQVADCQGIVFGSGDAPCGTEGRCDTRDVAVIDNELTNVDVGIDAQGGYQGENLVYSGNTRDGQPYDP